MKRGSSRGGSRAGVRWGLLLGLTLALTLPTGAEAQRRGQMGPRQREAMEEAREVLEARLREFFGNAVRTRLGLNDAEMESVRETLRAFEEERRELAGAEQELRGRLGPALGGAHEELTDGEAREVLEQLAELRMEEARLFRREQEALLEVLTPTQVVQLYKLRQAMINRIQRFRRGPPGGPRGPGGEGPPPPALLFHLP